MIFEEKERIMKELAVKKVPLERLDLPHIRKAIDEIKDEYSSNLNKYMDMQSNILTLKRLGIYDGQNVSEFDKLRENHEQFLKLIEKAKAQVMLLTDGPFYIREEALDYLTEIDAIKNGSRCIKRNFE